MCEDVSRRHCIQVPEVKEVEERGAKKCKVLHFEIIDAEITLSGTRFTYKRNVEKRC